MKASLFLGVTSAALALAGPMRVNKRALETEWVVELVTVTVTADQETAAGAFIERPTVVVPEPEPVATTTSKLQPKPITTSKPQPKPTTTSKLQPKPTTTSKPQPKPTTTTQAPVIVQPSSEPQPEQPSVGKYEDAILEQHNIHRRNHSSPDLVWDSTLAQYALNTAKGCVFQHDMTQGTGGYGQNLAVAGDSRDISTQQINFAKRAVTSQWYNGEVSNWKFYGSNNPPAGSNLLDWGHFTQVVWKSTTKLGCATVQCPAGSVLGLPSWYTVCNYGPPGNYGGQYGKNVLEPRGLATATV